MQRELSGLSRRGRSEAARAAIAGMSGAFARTGDETLPWTVSSPSYSTLDGGSMGNDLSARHDTDASAQRSSVGRSEPRGEQCIHHTPLTGDAAASIVPAGDANVHTVADTGHHDDETERGTVDLRVSTTTTTTTEAGVASRDACFVHSQSVDAVCDSGFVTASAAGTSVRGGTPPVQHCTWPATAHPTLSSTAAVGS